MYECVAGCTPKVDSGGGAAALEDNVGRVEVGKLDKGSGGRAAAKECAGCNARGESRLSVVTLRKTSWSEGNEC